MIKWIDNEDGEGGDCCTSLLSGVEGVKLAVDLVTNLVSGFSYNN